MAKADRTAIGFFNRARGEGFEKVLEDVVHSRYREAGTAVMFHVKQSAKPVRSRNGELVFVRAASMVDFVGILPPSGVAVAFDAKSTVGLSWSLPTDARHQRQWDILEAFNLAGGYGFFLVEFSQAMTVVAMRPMPGQPRRVSGVHYGQETPSPVLLVHTLLGYPDWLPAIARWPQIQAPHGLPKPAPPGPFRRP